MRRKGQALDLVVLMIGLFGFGLAIVIGWFILTSVGATDGFAGSAHYFDYGYTAFRALDFGMLIFLVGGGLAAIISAYYVRSHPIFFVISLLTLTILFVVAGALSNAFDAIVTSDTLMSAANEMPFTVTIMRNLPALVVMGIGLLASIAMYAKGGENNQGY